jgi:Flp pilus assembly protein TadD
MNLDLIAASRSLVEEAWKKPDEWEANLASAEAMLSKALREVPDDVLALTCLGAVLSDQGKHEKAAAVLERAIELRSTDRNTYFNLGVAKMNCATRAKAMAAFRDAEGRQASPLSWEAYFDPQAH